MTEKNILSATDTISNTFNFKLPFIIYFEVYTDGWFIEAARSETPDDRKYWFKMHTAPIGQNGKNYIILPGNSNLTYRMNDGTQGAVAYASQLTLGVFTDIFV